MGCDFPVNNTNELIIKQLKREISTLEKEIREKLLKQDGQIAETCLYIKSNLSSYLKEMLDSMNLSGELDGLIISALADLEPAVEKMRKDASTFKLYAPSLLGSLSSESIALIKNEEYAILFDTGIESSGLANVEYLKTVLGEQKINAVFISHYHLDHIGGLSYMEELISKDAKIYLPMDFVGYISSTEDDQEELITIKNDVMHWINKNKFRYVEVNTDLVVRFGELEVKILNSNPVAYSHYLSQNHRYNAFSMNCLVSLGDTKVYFPADSVKATQDYLLSIGQAEKVTVYASSHHGFERYMNSAYLSILNPEIEYFSAAPVSWDDVTMLSYDYNFKPHAPQMITEAYDDIVIGLSKTGATVLSGFYCKENMFLNKQYDIYINPKFIGIADGSKERPFRTVNQALTYLPKENCNITMHFAAGTYDRLRFVSSGNLIQIVSDGEEVIFSNCQFNNVSAIYFNGIKFIDPVVFAYGFGFFSECEFKCPSDASGNVCVTVNRANVSFGNCTFSNCYTGVYAQAGAQITARDCSFDCAGYVVYGINSYIGLYEYTILNGVLREDIGCTIKTIDKGATNKRPLFNGSDYMRGYKYFDTTIGKPIFYYNPDGPDAWIDATGTRV